MGDIVLQYRGAEYHLPAKKLFEVGAQIEDVAPLFDVIGWQSRPHFHKIATCLRIMLAAAGCKATDREVYAELMQSIHSRDGYLALALYALVAALMDGAPAGDGDASGESQPAS